MTIRGTGFGAARGKVDFSYGRNGVMPISARDISSWTDTSISCAVPTGVIDNYPASAGSGPVVVTTSTGDDSNPDDFAVSFGYLGAKWASPRVTYLLTTSGIDSARRESLVDAGTALWNGAGSAFRFTDGGPTSAGFAQDGLNVISWAYGLPDGVLAWTQSYAFDGIVSQCGIQFNNTYSWGAGSPLQTRTTSRRSPRTTSGTG